MCFNFWIFGISEVFPFDDHHSLLACEEWVKYVHEGYQQWFGAWWAQSSKAPWQGTRILRRMSKVSAVVSRSVSLSETHELDLYCYWRLKMRCDRKVIICSAWRPSSGWFWLVYVPRSHAKTAQRKDARRSVPMVIVVLTMNVGCSSKTINAQVSSLQEGETGSSKSITIHHFH